MATKTSNKYFNETLWPSFDKLSHFLNLFTKKMREIFSEDKDEIGTKLAKIKEDQVNKFDINLITRANLYSRRI